MDGRDKPGHDDGWVLSSCVLQQRRCAPSPRNRGLPRLRILISRKSGRPDLRRGRVGVGGSHGGGPRVDPHPRPLRASFARLDPAGGRGEERAPPVIASASEAIQGHEDSLDCFVASLLAMTSRVETCLRILAAQRARALREISSPRNQEGAGKAGCPPHPWSACSKKARGRTTCTGGSSGLPCAMVLRLIGDLPGDHAWLPPSPAGRIPQA